MGSTVRLFAQLSAAGAAAALALLLPLVACEAGDPAAPTAAPRQAGGAGGGEGDATVDADALQDAGMPMHDSGDAGMPMHDSGDAGMPMLDCGAGAVLTIPYPYVQNPLATFVADPFGMVFTLTRDARWPGIVPDAVGVGSYTGTFSIVYTPDIHTQILQVAADAANAYVRVYRAFADGGAEVALYGVARAGGPAIALIPPIGSAPGQLTASLEFAVGASDLYLVVTDPNADGGVGAVYAVPKAGGTLSSPIYSGASGRTLFSPSIVGSQLFWMEEFDGDAGPITEIRSAAVGANLQPTTFATVAPGAQYGEVAAADRVLFAQIVPPPPPYIPPPPPGDGGWNLPDAWGPPTGLFGVYEVAEGGMPVLVDPNFDKQLVVGGGVAYYTVSPSTIHRWAFGADAATEIATPDWVSLAVDPSSNLFYAMDHCVMRGP
jgi:hypothetical protein